MTLDNIKVLTDPKYPLIEKFKDIAPGTFKHCQNVANLCEIVSIELTLDVDLLRVSALYHDIGKINNPLYFSENQTDTNPHDNIDPLMSHQIITRHVGDSLTTLISIPEIPRQVLEIISQHHGNTVLQSIYNKVDGKEADLFRYKCKPPESPEALILMICDSIEASARAVYNEGNLTQLEDRVKLVTDTINRLEMDNQLDGMTIGMKNQVNKILCRELNQIYHKRVSYDQANGKTNGKETTE